MKIAPLMRAYRGEPTLQARLVHTGQHYDERMSQVFFEQLGLARPDFHLGVGAGSHAQQTARIMERFEPVVLAERPDVVLVVGDVNSTLACALVAKKLGVRLVHVEAGLRSFDQTMPEEINRVLTDAISDLLFATEPAAVVNLEREGVDGERVYFVGSLMIDTLLRCRQQAESSTILQELGVQPGGYGVLTLHRAGNVDKPEVLGGILEAIEVIQRDLPVVFPVHPRTRKQLAQTGLAERLQAMPAVRLLEPLGYLDFLKLLSSAAVVLTDSGGIQEETTILGVPCLTIRQTTEHPVTIEQGTNRLVGTDPAGIVAGYRQVQACPIRTTRRPEKWDGKAAERIVHILREWG